MSGHLHAGPVDSEAGEAEAESGANSTSAGPPIDSMAESAPSSADGQVPPTEQLPTTEGNGEGGAPSAAEGIGEGMADRPGSPSDDEAVGEGAGKMEDGNRRVGRTLAVEATGSKEDEARESLSILPDDR